ncbi:MAG: hypothetical protein GY697_04465 [Desulfobacterales bacterium]|nr:hypothetical protein [Desulfobacterales bacterium]
MADDSTVEGKQSQGLFKQLIRANTLITMRVRGVEGYQRLTMITDIREIRGNHAFAIDPPAQFQEKVGDLPDWNIHFKFTGPDKIEYSFSTHGGQVEGKEIWIPFPYKIKRIQRRKYFRIDTPPGTQVKLQVKKTPRLADILNISQGGLLCVLVRLKKEIRTDPVLKIGDHFSSLTLACPNEEAPDDMVPIKAAVVRRVEADPNHYRHRYALEFLDMTFSEQNDLTQLIYRLQREFLRKR